MLSSVEKRNTARLEEPGRVVSIGANVDQSRPLLSLNYELKL